MQFLCTGLGRPTISTYGRIWSLNMSWYQFRKNQYTPYLMLAHSFFFFECADRNFNWKIEWFASKFRFFIKLLAHSWNFGVSHHFFGEKFWYWMRHSWNMLFFDIFFSCCFFDEWADIKIIARNGWCIFKIVLFKILNFQEISHDFIDYTTIYNYFKLRRRNQTGTKP